jgi:alpha-D-xyloside xylohydrolase
MPYIYTLAGDAYHRDSTMMRGLVMDFPGDPAVHDIATQYMFGPALLVNPVTEYRARTRDVYLPGGTDWYDFHTGQRYSGGRTITAQAPLAELPLFVRAGSVLPTGPDIQHTGESLNAPLTLNVFTGADGAFEIYEDDGLSYAYERGEFSRIPVRYDDESGAVVIGARTGRFDGMAASRRISVRWFDGARVPAEFDAVPDSTVTYTGVAMRIERP